MESHMRRSPTRKHSDIHSGTQLLNGFTGIIPTEMIDLKSDRLFLKKGLQPLQLLCNVLEHNIMYYIMVDSYIRVMTAHIDKEH